MSSLNFQKAFAKILVDAQLRKELLEGKLEEFGDLSLDKAQMENLLKFDNRLLEEYSKMLVATRISSVLSVLTCTKKLIPEKSIEQIAGDYESRVAPVPVAGSPTIEEVKRFAVYAENSAENFRSIHPLLNDVIKFEANHFLLKHETTSETHTAKENPGISEKDLSRSKPKIPESAELLCFDYDITEIIQSLTKNITPVAEKKETFLLLIKIGASVAVKKINKTVYSLLKLCDGRTTCAEILEKFLANSDVSESFRQSIEKTLAEFMTKGVLIDG